MQFTGAFPELRTLQEEKLRVSRLNSKIQNSYFGHYYLSVSGLGATIITCLANPVAPPKMVSAVYT
jgi:hypothetical protein